MASHAQIAVGTSATSLTTTDNDDVEGQSLHVQNPSAGTVVYLGGPGVTAASYGYALLPGAGASVDLEPREPLYAVVETGTVTVNVLYQGA